MSAGSSPLQSRRASPLRHASPLHQPSQPPQGPSRQPTQPERILAAGIILLREPEEGEMEVLIGRYEVINGLKSERNRRPVPMRFAGEYHFPGGAKRQTDIGPLQTACRELHEEFGIGVMNSSSGVMGPPELAATLFRKAQVDLGSQEVWKDVQRLLPGWVRELGGCTAAPRNR